MNNKKLYVKMVNSQKNVQFNDFVTIIEAFAFYCSRQEGSHRIYKNPAVHEFINVQDENGKAKPYQIKQFLSLVEQYNLKLED